MSNSAISSSTCPPSIGCNDCDRTFETCISWDHLINTVALRIRRSLDLQQVLQTTVDEVYRLLGCDRTLIYQFAPDWSGCVIAEAVSDPQWSLLDRVIHDICFQASWLGSYQETRYFAIENVATANLTPCHAEFLAGFQIQANLVIPICHEDTLWGLLIAHHCQSPRPWNAVEIEGLRLLGVQVGIAIHQASLIAQLQGAKATLESTVAERTHELAEANQQLRQEMHRYQQLAAIVESSQDAIISKTLEGIITSWNRGAEAIFGYTVAEIVGQSITALIPPDRQSEATQILQHIRQGQEVTTYETQRRHQDGHILDVAITVSPLRDEAGTIIGASKIARDITAQKQEERLHQATEAALRQSEATNRALIQAIPDFLVRMQRDGTQLEIINTGNVHCLYPAHQSGEDGNESIENHNVLDIMPTPIAQERIQMAQEAIATGTPQRQEFSFVQNGQTYYEEARISPINDDEVLVMVRDISIRKQVELQLQNREREYRLLVENLPAGVVVHGPNTDILTNNSRATELLGLTIEQMQGKTAIDPAWSFLEEDGITPMPLENYPINRVLESNQPIENLVLGINRPSHDNPVWVLVNAYPLFGDDGKLDRVIVTFVDITAQKQAQFDLIASEQRYAALAATVPVGIFRSDIAGNSIFANQGLSEISGLPLEALLGQGWLKAIHPDDLDMVRSTWQAANGQQQPYKCEHRFWHDDGQVVWVMAHAEVERNATGQVMGYVGVLTDISDRKRAELELHSLKEQLELVLQASSEGFWDWNLTTNEIYFSPHWKEMLGYGDDELDNTFEMWESVIFEEDRLAALQLVEAYNRGRVKHFSAVQRFHHKDGSTVHILSRAVHVKDAEGRAVRIVGSHLDITPTIHVQEALKNSEMQLSGILNGSMDGIMAFRAIRDEGSKIIDFEWLSSNPAACELVNHPPDALIGQRLLDILPENYTNGLFDLYVQVVETGMPSQRQFHYSHDGIDTWFENIAVKLGDGFTVTFRDISLLKTSEQALQKANQDLESHIHDLRQRNQEMLLLSETSDFLQACRSLDEACSVIATLVEPLFPGFSGSFYITCASRNRIEAVAQWGEMATSKLEFQPYECWALRRGKWHQTLPDSSRMRCQHITTAEPLLTTLCIPMIAQGETLGMFYLRTLDATLLSEAKQQLARTVAEQVGLAIANLHLRETLQNQSIRDGLTGLFNRRYLEEALHTEIARAQRHGYSSAVVMVDVDHFKAFNDQYGHDAGDIVLKAIAQVIKNGIRESDIACRYGGEELTLVFPDTFLKDAMVRAENLRVAIEQISITYGKQTLHRLTASFGIAIFPDHGSNGLKVIQAADAALYRAKAAGRNQVMNAEAIEERTEN